MKYSSLWNDEYISTMQRYFEYEKGKKKYLTELWKEKIWKKYRIFTIAHAQHTTSTWTYKNAMDSSKRTR